MGYIKGLELDFVLFQKQKKWALRNFYRWCLSQTWEKTLWRKMQSGKLKTTFLKNVFKSYRKVIQFKENFLPFFAFYSTFKTFSQLHFHCRFLFVKTEIEKQHWQLQKVAVASKSFSISVAKLCDQFWNSNTQMATNAIVWLDIRKNSCQTSKNQ